MATNDDLETSTWATDTQVSLPEPSPFDILVDMGTLGFTMYGIAHNISLADVENYSPNFVGNPHE